MIVEYIQNSTDLYTHLYTQYILNSTMKINTVHIIMTYQYRQEYNTIISICAIFNIHKLTQHINKGICYIHKHKYKQSAKQQIQATDINIVLTVKSYEKDTEVQTVNGLGDIAFTSNSGLMRQVVHGV